MIITTRIRNCFTAVGALAVLAACGGDSATAPAPETRLIVENGSTQAILIVNFGFCTDPTWGPDRLGATEIIAAGAERSWTVPAGCYDVRARAEDLASTVWLDVQIAAGTTTRLKATSFSASTAASTAPTGRARKLDPAGQ